MKQNRERNLIHYEILGKIFSFQSLNRSGKQTTAQIEKKT